jgi:hypothetical protein
MQLSNGPSPWSKLTNGQRILVALLWLCCFAACSAIAVLLTAATIDQASSAGVSLGALSLLLLPPAGMGLWRVSVGAWNPNLRPLFPLGVECTLSSGIGALAAFVMCEWLMQRSGWMSLSSGQLLFVSIYSFVAATAMRINASIEEKPQL